MLRRVLNFCRTGFLKFYSPNRANNVLLVVSQAAVEIKLYIKVDKSCSVKCCFFFTSFTIFIKVAFYKRVSSGAVEC